MYHIIFSFFIFFARVQIKSNLAAYSETMMLMMMMTTMSFLVRQEKNWEKIRWLFKNISSRYDLFQYCILCSLLLTIKFLESWCIFVRMHRTVHFVYERFFFVRLVLQQQRYSLSYFYRLSICFVYTAILKGFSFILLQIQ